MAAIENDHLVVNVVYTGPPLAGKTQSVRALMPLLQGRGADQKVYSPGDWRGRTAFFDWAEYEGGAFDGKSIQCRIISTPGQVALSDRREMLLRAADAVILVIDSRADALERAMHCYEEMAPWLAESSREVPVRVVLQCNKQDLPGSLPPEELKRRLPVPCGKDAYGTSASTGKGLRAAFVAGVRNAVDRARALVARGLLEVPEFTTGEELFERMRRETAPIGSLRPSSPSMAPNSSYPVPAESPSSAAPAARSRSDGGRGAGARASDRALPSESPSPRSAHPAPSREAHSASSGPSPFGAGKPQSSSGFYPSMSARSSSAAPRSGAGQPTLPPDHPFASNPPAKPSTRRPSSGSSRRAPSGRASSSAPGGSRAVPRPKAGESPAPSSGGEEPARGRPHHSAQGTAPGTRRGLAGNDSTTTGTRVRPNRPGIAKAPAPSGDALAARGSTDGTTTTPAAYAETRARLGGAAAHGARDASAPHGAAPLESHRSPTASLHVTEMGAAVAVDALSSAPPSSGTAAVPESTTRRALVPPYSEPRAAPERRAEAPAGPHPKGWLDPAGEPARTWRPGQGARPAVMPASIYRALVPREAEAPPHPPEATLAHGASDSSASEGQPAIVRADATARDDLERRPRAPAQSAPRATAKTFATGGPRPAVMPASAYFAILAERAAASAATSETPASSSAEPASAPATAAAAEPAAPARARPPTAGGAGRAPTLPKARPAVMPASAWRAAEEARAAEQASAARPETVESQPIPSAAQSGIAPSATPSPDDDPVDSGWPDAGEVLSMPPPFALPATRSAPATRAAKRPGSRPAVMPASVWRAMVERGELPGTDATPSLERAPDGASAAGESGAAAGGATPSLRLLRGGAPLPRESVAAATARASLTLLERPAVRPADAWLASRASTPAAPPPATPPGERPTITPNPDAAASAADAPAADAPAADAPAADAPAAEAPAGAASTGDRPTAVESAAERPSIVASTPPEPENAASGTATNGAPAPEPEGAASAAPASAPAPEPEDAASAALAPEEFADPTAFGLESSRVIAVSHTPGEETGESFRIPETPPGLQAFIVESRQSAPPSAAGDEVIQSLPPTLDAAIDAASNASGAEARPPLEFPGPRMPGHARAPLAVWRRSTWRTLETHINSDATALEDSRGRWIGELAPGWYARTLRSAGDLRSARRAFAEEVLRERRLSQYLSRPRCVALTEEADRFWIWQAACRVPTLAAVLGRRLAARESPSAMAEALLDASLAFIEARQRFIKARVPLPLSLHALSVQDDKLVYSGLLPDPGAVFVHPTNDGHTAFEDALRKKWPGGAVDGGAVFAELSIKAAGRLPEPILEIIRSVAGQSSVETITNEVSG